MHHCPICGEDFMDSDEFIAHVQKHSLDELARYTDTLARVFGTGATEPVESLAQTIGNVVVEKIRPIISPLIIRAPLKPKPTFEAMELTRMAIENNKPPAEVFETYKELLGLFSEEEKHEAKSAG